MSASPKWLAAPATSVLFAPGGGSPEESVRTFLKTRQALFGLLPEEIDQLELTAEVSAPGAAMHLYFTQKADGLEVLGGRLSATVRADGALLWLGSRLYAGIDASATPTVEALEAVRLAARDVHPDRLVQGDVLEAAETADRKTVFAGSEFGCPLRARLVLFPEAAGARLAWEVRIAEREFDTDYLLLVDALDGRLLFRRNMTFYASARVLLAGEPDPESEEWSPAQHVLVELPSTTPESPGGWIGGSGTELSGNNATTYLASLLQPGPSDPMGVFEFPFNTDESALVNAWYWVNDTHDRFYAAGFDEAAGNFQQDNFGGGGVAGDPVGVLAKASGVYARELRSSFSPTVDGEAPVLSFRWKVGCRYCADHDGFPENGGDRSVGFMRDVLVHEYAHGVTSRRVGGPADDSCLYGVQSGAMAEGWSDLFAASFFDEPRFGEYFTEGTGWQRDVRQDLRYGDLGYAGNKRAYDGMIWSGALWDLRQSMIALDPAAGLADFHQLVVESLASTPCAPTFLDGRDALLAADALLFGSAHQAVIWNVFAARGMGELASTSGENDTFPVADDTVPASFACTPPADPSGLAAAVEGGNAVRLSYSAPGASAVEIWRDDLDNPADASVRIAYTTDLSTTLDTTVQGEKRYRYHLVALGPGGVVCRSTPSPSADVTAIGACTAEFPLFVPNLTVSDGDPDCAVTLTWDAATEACPGSGEPIVYNVYRSGPASLLDPPPGAFAGGLGTPGFQPSDRLLIGRTTTTSLVDTPVDLQPGSQWFESASYYLVLAQHGTLDDRPDHRDRGSSQVLQWVPAIPTLGRTSTLFWDFESGPQGWTNEDGSGGQFPGREWMRVDPEPTYWGGTLLAPDVAASGSGKAWVTGDAGGGPSNVTSNACEETQILRSPTWDATDGSTILSFDYWAHGDLDELYSGLFICVENGSTGNCTRDMGMLTTQRFLGPGRYGWQRAELDLSRLVTPTSTMSVRFAGANCAALAEFGIDNVRVERATVCSRSDLVLQSITVDDSAPGWGNGNGVLEPGEVARLTVELFNEGSATAMAPTGTVTSRALGAAVLDGDTVLPDIGAGATASSVDDGFTVAAPQDDCVGTVVFEFVFTDASGERSTAMWTPEFGTIVTDTLLQDDFEMDQGWTASGAGPLEGGWVRADPIGTLDGSSQANPEDDSPNDANAICYVTGNEPGAPDLDDVDPGTDAVLVSPAVSVEGYRRVHFGFDYWFYDTDQYITDKDSMLSAVLDDGDETLESFVFTSGRSFWRSSNGILPDVFLNPMAPAGSTLRLSFVVNDDGVDTTVEAAVDNVRIEADRQVCEPVGVFPPNAVGNTLFVDKSASMAQLSWTAPPADAMHAAAVFYKVYVSGGPSGGFGVADTPTSTVTMRALATASEYYVVGAVNGGGASADDLVP